MTITDHTPLELHPGRYVASVNCQVLSYRGRGHAREHIHSGIYRYENQPFTVPACVAGCWCGIVSRRGEGVVQEFFGDGLDAA